jgi:hypothetical protein
VSSSHSKLIYESDELSRSWAASECYTSKDAAVRALWLESYDGGPRSIDRMIRGNVYAPRWSAVISGTIHPGQLVGMAQYRSAIGLFLAWAHGGTSEERRTCSRRSDRASRPPVPAPDAPRGPSLNSPYRQNGRHLQRLAMGFGGALPGRRTRCPVSRRNDTPPLGGRAACASVVTDSRAGDRPGLSALNQVGARWSVATLPSHTAHRRVPVAEIGTCFICPAV